MKRFPARSSVLVVILMTLVVVTLLVVSPLLLVLMNNVIAVDWSQLSNIGQSFTAVSAILSAGALFAVALTFRLQAKQTRLIQFTAAALRDLCSIPAGQGCVPAEVITSRCAISAAQGVGAAL